MNASTAITDPQLRQAGMRLSGMPTGRLDARDLDVLFQVRLGLSRLRVPFSLDDSAISSRTVMNNAG